MITSSCFDFFVVANRVDVCLLDSKSSAGRGEFWCNDDVPSSKKFPIKLFRWSVNIFDRSDINLYLTCLFTKTKKECGVTIIIIVLDFIIIVMFKIYKKMPFYIYIFLKSKIYDKVYVFRFL